MKTKDIESALLAKETPSREVLEALSDLSKTEPKAAAPLIAIVEDRVFHSLTKQK